MKRATTSNECCFGGHSCDVAMWNHRYKKGLETQFAPIK